MALVTLLLLLVFVAMALRTTLSRPPGFLVSLAEKGDRNLDPLAMWTVIYGLAAIVLTPFFVDGGLSVLIRMLAALSLLLLALPAGSEQLIVRYLAHRDAAAESLRDIVARLSVLQPALAYAGAVLWVLLFLSMLF